MPTLIRKTFGILAATAVVALFFLLPNADSARAQAPLKIGFLSSMTGPAAVLGIDMANGARLALETLGGRIGGRPAELLVEDDGVNPQTGVQKAQKLLEKDRVDILAGTIFGHVTQAVHGVVTPSGTFMVATVGSIPPILGPLCHENYFTVSWVIDANYAALGTYLNDKGIDSVALMAPNYIAGKLISAGFKRTYKGSILAEIYTKVNQPDYSVEIAQVRARAPKATVVFYPGGMGINFLKQYQAAGALARMPVYSSVFIADESTFPALGDIPLGMITTSNWNPELDNPANRAFVATYVKKHGKRPTSMAAMGFDTIALIAAAADAVNGRIDDKAAFRAALRKADFGSVRGPFRFNHNHFPVQNYYLNEVAKDADGKLYNKLLGVALENHEDAYHEKCPMKW